MVYEHISRVWARTRQGSTSSATRRSRTSRAPLTDAFAYVSFPNPLPVAGVPVTLQVLGVFLAGLFLGPVWGVAAMVLYPVAAFAVGYVAHGGLELSDPSRVGVGRLVGSMVLGTAIIYGIGVAGLMLVLGLDSVPSRRSSPARPRSSPRRRSRSPPRWASSGATPSSRTDDRMIEVRELVHRYGETTAVDGVSLRIPDGGCLLLAVALRDRTRLSPSLTRRGVAGTGDPDPDTYIPLRSRNGVVFPRDGTGIGGASRAKT
jgi:hypothetical protein